jgi:hypothetical protein
MNEEPFFIPAWATSALGAKQAREVADVAQELQLLRVFFQSWEKLHAIQNKPENKHKMEVAAQTLVDAADAIRMARGTVIEGSASAG